MSGRFGAGRGVPDKEKYDGMIAGLYDLGETIGKGHYAVVKLAKHVFTGEKVAVKVIDKSRLDEISKSHLFQEVRCMKLVQHPHVVRLYEVIDTQTKLLLILEWGDGGDMYDYIMKHEKGLGENMARHYFRQIVQAISYCHRLHVVHRDLKPENVVFFEKLGIVKLTDFGFSNKFIPGRKLETSCGSLAYSAPEILLGDSYDAPAVDVWSLGVILYMLVCGVAPFHEANDSETLTMIMDCKYCIPSHVSSLCQNIIGRMLVREPSQRATLDDIIMHPWMAEGNLIPVTQTPLVCRAELSEEDHNHVIQKIIDGHFATKQEILDSLEQRAYDHITATYYLLAERLLRKRGEALLHGPRPTSDMKLVLSPLALSPRTNLPELSGDMSKQDKMRTPFDCLVSPPGSHSSPPSAGVIPSGNTPDRQICRCPLAHEDGIDSTEGNGTNLTPDQCKLSRDRQLLKPHVPAEPSTHALLEVPNTLKLLSPLRQNLQLNNNRPLFSVHSSPQLLNEIYEEGESDDEDDSDSLKPHISRIQHAIVSPEVMRKFDRLRKKRVNAIGQRTTSCSSSDTSDTDDVDPNRKPKVKVKPDLPRRDSSEHSSDTDGPSGLGGGRNSCASGGCSNYRVSPSKGGQTEQKQQGSDKGSGGGEKGRSKTCCSEKKETSRMMKETKSNLSSPSVHCIDDGTNSLIKTCDAGYISKNSPDGVDHHSFKSSKENRTSGMDKTTSSSNKTSSISTQVIHVRSRDFSDLVEKFANIQEEMVDIRSGSPLYWNEEDYLVSQIEHHIKNHTRTSPGLRTAGLGRHRSSLKRENAVHSVSWIQGGKISI